MITRYGEAAAALVSISFLRRALEAADLPDMDDFLEAKSAILPQQARSETQSPDEPFDGRPDAEELLDRIDRTRHAVGLPPLDR